MQERKPLKIHAYSKKLVKHNVPTMMQSEKIILAKEEQKRLNRLLIIASEEGETADIPRLVKANADIMVRENVKYGWTALHAATHQNRIQACAMLIREYARLGGDVNGLISATDNFGKTALQYAIEDKYTETARFLESMEWLLELTGKEFMKSFSECVAA